MGQSVILVVITILITVAHVSIHIVDKTVKVNKTTYMKKL